MHADGRECRTNPPHHLHIRGAGPITRCNGIHDTQYVPLHHAHEIQVVFALRHVAEMLDEVHDVRTVVHGILAAHPLDLWAFGNVEREARPTYSF